MTNNKQLRRRFRKECRNLCRNVRRLRIQHGFSRIGLAKKLKISPATLCVLELGIIPSWLSTETLFYMQELFSVSVMELFL